MTDIINLNSIRSGDCDCNKPKKPICGCQHDHKPQHNCHQAIDLSDQYFKVKNLFGELKSEWQRAEARSNLGVTDIIDLEQTQSSNESEGRNVWTMTVAKGGSKRLYDFVVLNGKKGDSATVEVLRTNQVGPDEAANVENVSGDDSHVKLVFYIPEGKKGKDGENGENGKSAYELAVANGFIGSLQEWLDSLKGKQGEKGESSDEFAISTIKLISVDQKDNVELPNGTTFSGACLVWRVKLNNGDTKDFWVPFNVSYNPGGDDGGKYRYNVFLFKIVNFSKIPTEVELETTLTRLISEVTGKTDTQLINNYNWSEQAGAIPQDGTQYIFMASCVVTDEAQGPWSVVRLTPRPGEQGPPGAQGDPGEGQQGFIAPVIRMMGTYNSNTTYVNETYKTYGSVTEVHFIDVVYYRSDDEDDRGNWYAVKEGSPSDTNGITVSGQAPTNSAYWKKATNFDFAFINTLVADAISSVSIDTEEIRIHDKRNGGDIIVAGMTSGNPVTYGDLTENLVFDNGGENGAVRIWAGSDFDTKGGAPNFNLYDSKFRVHQNGHLYAEDADITGKVTSHDADIEGTIQANILRLGEHKSNKEGTFICPTASSDIMLPELIADKIQMFYILTNSLPSESVKIAVPSHSSNSINQDKIRYKNITTDEFVDDIEFTLSKNKLYQLFGINQIWHVVEMDLIAASAQINNEEINSYGIKQITIVPYDEWTHPQQGENAQSQYLLQSQNIKGSVVVEFFNTTDSGHNINVPPIDVTIRYTAAQIQPTEHLLAAAPNIQLLYAVEYTLRLTLGQIAIQSTPRILVDNYSANTSGTYTQVSSIGYNGTIDNPSSEVPDIGNVIVTPSIINYAFGTVDNKTAINLTNIPIS